MGFRERGPDKYRKKYRGALAEATNRLTAFYGRSTVYTKECMNVVIIRNIKSNF